VRKAPTSATVSDEKFGDNIGDADRVALAQRIAQLTLEHRDLDMAIATIERDVTHDELSVRRMKRRKLLLKDEIARLSRQIDPDVPA